MPVDAFVAQLKEDLDPGSRLPLYEQVAHAVRQAVYHGRLATGAVLPPEPELAQRLGVSRQTVNQALTMLAQQGLLTRRRGVGTFVAEPIVEQPLEGLYTFIRTLTTQGRHPANRILGQRVTTDDEASLLFTDRPEGLVFELTRLRLADGEPVILETIYLPLECGERIPFERFAQEPLYNLMRELCGIEVEHADETLQPVSLGRTEAALLGLEGGEPAFLVERTGFDGERPVELRRSLIRGDRYRFRVRLSGDRLG
jgi:GntR family transcriptional regulator